eukprot:365878-Chlamydomonas_euryale.AAC.4
MDGFHPLHRYSMEKTLVSVFHERLPPLPAPPPPQRQSCEPTAARGQTIRRTESPLHRNPPFNHCTLLGPTASQQALGTARRRAHARLDHLKVTEWAPTTCNLLHETGVWSPISPRQVQPSRTVCGRPMLHKPEPMRRPHSRQLLCFNGHRQCGVPSGPAWPPARPSLSPPRCRPCESWPPFGFAACSCPRGQAAAQCCCSMR